MGRRIATLGLAIGLALLAAPGLAQSMQDRLVRQLQADGFTRIVVSQTWLGRTRIVATAPGRKRELVFNPASGEILRDFLDLSNGGSGSGGGNSGGGLGGGGNSGGGTSGGGGSGGGGSGGGNDDDGNDDDGNDDDDDDDDDDDGDSGGGNDDDGDDDDD